MTETEQLQQWISESRRIVFFGGAGVSTESGIPDFRSVDGLYRQQYDDPPETVLSHSYFMEKPEQFFRFYRSKMLAPDARPNAAHRKLAELERAGKLSAVITQNIDGLHQKAGSRRVLELHGSVYRNACQRCGERYTLDQVMQAPGVPRCACGGVIKPEVVLYGEKLDGSVLRQSAEAIRSADLMIVGGTSLAVYPAAGLVDHYSGSRLVLINRQRTPLDSRADLVLHVPIGQVFGQIHV